MPEHVGGVGTMPHADPSASGPGKGDDGTRQPTSPAASPAAPERDALEGLLTHIREDLRRAEQERENEQLWIRSRQRLRTALWAAEHFALRDSNGDFATAWAVAWWDAINALRTEAGVTSVRNLGLPAGHAFAVAADILDRGLGPTGSLEQVNEDLVRALAVLLPRPASPDQRNDRDDAGLLVQFDTAHDRLSPGGSVSALRQVFGDILPMALECIDRRWADRVPAAAVGSRGGLLPALDSPIQTETWHEPAERACSLPDGTTAPGSPAGSNVSRVDPDGLWIVVRGRRFDFTPGQQAAVIRELYAKWKEAGGQDGCGMTKAAIAEALEAHDENFRLPKAFRGNLAWGTILREVGKGRYALFLNNPGNRGASGESPGNPR